MNPLIKIISTVILLDILIFCSVKTAKATISFTISNPVIDSDDQIEVDASISGLIISSCSTSGCFLQAELQSAGGYFGYTYNNSGEFVDYFKNPVSTDDIKTKLFNFVPISGCWNGKLIAKNNSTNQYYYGPGDYLLSFRRFSGNSVSPTSGDSNSLSVSLTEPTPTPSPTDTPQPTPTLTPTLTPFELKTPGPTPTPFPSPSPTPKRTPSPIPVSLFTPLALATEDISTDSAEDPNVLGTQNEFDEKDPASASAVTKTNNTFPILAIGLTSLGIGAIGFSVFSIIKNAKKSYTIGSEKEDSKIS